MLIDFTWYSFFLTYFINPLRKKYISITCVVSEPNKSTKYILCTSTLIKYSKLAFYLIETIEFWPHICILYYCIISYLHHNIFILIFSYYQSTFIILLYKTSMLITPPYFNSIILIYIFPQSIALSITHHCQYNYFYNYCLIMRLHSTARLLTICFITAVFCLQATNIHKFLYILLSIIVALSGQALVWLDCDYGL